MHTTQHTRMRGHAPIGFVFAFSIHPLKKFRQKQPRCVTGGTGPRPSAYATSQCSYHNNVRLSFLLLPLCLLPAQTPETPLSALPYSPSLDLTSMDRTVNPCTDFYRYSCGGWIKKNPIPPDQSRWDVYGKLAEDNQRFLWGILEEA